MKLTLELSFPGYTPVRIIEGTEEMSALYVYDILIRTEESCVEVRKQLGKAVDVILKDDEGKILRKIHGVVMSIESTRQYTSGLAEKSSEGHDYAWYKWTIRPAFAKACYSRNRLVYNADELGTTFPDIGKKLLSEIVRRWDKQVSILFSEKAEARIPEFIQLVQNDESDYNFFSRILAAWGLGYFWRTAIEEGKGMTVGVGKVLCIFDATCKDEKVKIDEKGVDVFEAGETKMQAVSQQASFWKCNYGVQDIDSTNIKVANYNSSSSLSGDAEVFLSLHDETWDQLKSGAGNDSSDIFMASHDNGCVCHGKYEYRDENTTGYENIGIGRKAEWESTKDVQCGTETYFITKLTVSATDKIWKVVMEGRKPKKESCLGVLPRPVHVNDRPDLSDEPLIQGEAWPEPRMRTFMAVVEDEKNYSSASNSSISNRNLYKVREIAGCKAGDASLNNSMWVEMGSPFADKNSGFLARPRKGNVLFCLDRGDLSIPIVLTSLFRDGNAAPYADLPEIDRKTSKPIDRYMDMEAVTIRNRTYNKADGTSSEIEKENVRKVMKPRSVHELYKDKFHFSQIQLVGCDNGVYPTHQKDNMSAIYTGACSTETFCGAVTGGNNFGSMAALGILDAEVDSMILPVRRPHFQGVNVYSEKDVLLQSADTQFINAGGSIHLTAAASITLQVGRNSIKITEKGIEIINGCGQVKNSGAHVAYESVNQEIPVLMNTYNNQIVFNQSGIGIQGVNINQVAFNNARMCSATGAGLTVNNWTAELTSPHTTVTGGAALINTLVFGVGVGVVVNMALGGKTAKSGSSPVVYVDELKDCRYQPSELKKEAEGGAIGLGLEILKCVGGAISVVDNVKNAFSMSGSMVDMCPETLSFTSNERWDVTCTRNTSETPLASLMALAHSGLGSFAALGMRPATWVASKLAMSKMESNCLGYRASSALLDKKEAVRQTFDLLDNETKALKVTTSFLKEASAGGSTIKKVLDEEINVLKSNKSNVDALASQLRSEESRAIGNRSEAVGNIAVTLMDMSGTETHT